VAKSCEVRFLSARWVSGIHFRLSLGEFLVENLAGDLEYHPRRAVLYLGLGVAAACFWVFSSPETRFTAIPLVFALGSLTLVVKGVFLSRKSSEGFGLSGQEVSELSNRSNRKDLPSFPYQVAQIVRDFGAGGMLLWPLLRYGKGLGNSWDNAPSLKVFVSGAFLVVLGWLVRRLTSPPQP
jgi:hypothetical protein